MKHTVRQCLLHVEEWLLAPNGMRRVTGINLLFTKKDAGGIIKLIVAKVIDDFLIAGTAEDIKLFMKYLSTEFDVVKTAIGVCLGSMSSRVTSGSTL